MAQFDVEKILDWLFGWNLIYLPKIVAAFFILFIGWRLAKKIAKLVVLLMRRSKVDETLVGFLENILSTWVWAGSSSRPLRTMERTRGAIRSMKVMAPAAARKCTIVVEQKVS